VTRGGNGGVLTGSSGGSSALVVDVLTPPPPPVIAGCLERSGTALTGATVKIRQKSVHQETTTDNDGCYAFTSPLSEGGATITIEVPAAQ
jgi:hypothetical protein